MAATSAEILLYKCLCFVFHGSISLTWTHKHPPTSALMNVLSLLLSNQCCQCASTGKWADLWLLVCYHLISGVAFPTCFSTWTVLCDCSCLTVVLRLEHCTVATASTYSAVSCWWTVEGQDSDVSLWLPVTNCVDRHQGNMTASGSQ